MGSPSGARHQQLRASWRRIVTNFLLASAALAVLCLAGLALHVASHALSDGPSVRAHVSEAALSGTLADKDEPRGPTRLSPSWFSDCVTLSILWREDGPTSWRGLMMANAIAWIPEETYCATLARGIANPDDVGWFDYARYWHGNLVFHRLGLSVFTYETFRMVLAALTFAALLVFAFSIMRLAGGFSAAVFAGLILAATDFATSATMPTQAISLIALLLSASALMHVARRRPERFWLAALCAGAVYNYFDFLYNPPLLAGLAAFAALYAAIRARVAPRPALWRALSGFALVLAGYGIMWSLKWGLAALAVWQEGGTVEFIRSGDFSRWSAAGSDAPTLFAATASVFLRSFSGWQPMVLFGIAAALAAVLAWRHNVRGVILLAMAPVILALATLELIAVHTIAHVWFTHRSLIWLLAMAIALIVSAALSDPSASGPRPRRFRRPAKHRTSQESG